MLKILFFVFKQAAKQLIGINYRYYVKGIPAILKIGGLARGHSPYRF